MQYRPQGQMLSFQNLERNFPRLEISVLVAYGINIVGIFRFHFFTFLMQTNDCPGKKRVDSHSSMCSVHTLLTDRQVCAKIAYVDNIKSNSGFSSPLIYLFISKSLYSKCGSAGITGLFGLPCCGSESSTFTYRKV